MPLPESRREPLQLHAPTAVSVALVEEAKGREEFEDLLPTIGEMKLEIRRGMSYHFALANFREDLQKITADSFSHPVYVSAFKPFEPLKPYRQIAGLAITQPYRPQRGPFRRKSVREILELRVAESVAWEPVVRFLIQQCKDEVIRNATHVLRFSLAKGEEALENLLWADGFSRQGKHSMAWLTPRKAVDS